MTRGSTRHFNGLLMKIRYWSQMEAVDLCALLNCTNPQKVGTE
jgi:hypothetical protein